LHEATAIPNTFDKTEERGNFTFMAIPLLTYSPSSQNQRVAAFEVPGDNQPRLYTATPLLSPSDFDSLIAAAYRQIFNEQQMTASSRQLILESQLRAQQITVKDFIRGLATSEVFRSRNYDSNTNYRFVQMCVQRILGRDVYSDREKFAWSTVLATQGLYEFIDQLVNSNEYQANFGDQTVPYQRRRILPNQTQGELPFARMARYGTEYRNQLPKPSRKAWTGPGADGLFTQFEPFDWQTFVARSNGAVVAGLAITGVALMAVMLAIAGTAQ
jgi:phycobilisome rod-core linker protein